MRSLVFFLCFLLSGVSTTFAFSDVGGSAYENNILSLKEQGVVVGYEDGSFRPGEKVNRAELLKMLMAALEPEAAEYEGYCFPDVEDQWFAPYVCRARDLKIVSGYDDGLFRPAEGANMVEAFKMVLLAFEMPLEDLADGEDWYEPYRKFIHYNDILAKFAYSPDKAITRAELALVVDNVLKIKKGDKPLNDDEVVLTSGCGEVPPYSPLQEFDVDGEKRNAITYVPANYDSNKAYSLIFAFHGRTSPNNVVRQYFRLEKPTQGEAIIVYPAARKNGDSFYWTGDSQFFDVMLSDLSGSYCIDKDKIFVLGHSLGSGFANDLACVRGNVIRAVASLGGAGSNIRQCSGRVASMQLHNPNDNLASYNAAVYMRNWYVERNQCTSQTREASPFWADCEAYVGCKEYAPYVFCPYKSNYDHYSGAYYPHNWPVAAGEEMWAFFESLN